MAKGYWRGEIWKGKSKKIKRCNVCGQFIAKDVFLAHIKAHRK